MSDVLILWALLLLYGVPLFAVAYWMEGKMREGDDGQ